jgi:hypothetical protein
MQIFEHSDKRYDAGDAFDELTTGIEEKPALLFRRQEVGRRDVREHAS